jgi:hypothetical protein
LRAINPESCCDHLFPAGCRLRQPAKEVLDRVQSRVPFSVEEAAVSQTSARLARYGHNIPVIVLDGEEIARHFVRERKLLKLMQLSTQTAEDRRT